MSNDTPFLRYFLGAHNLEVLRDETTRLAERHFGGRIMPLSMEPGDPFPAALAHAAILAAHWPLNDDTLFRANSIVVEKAARHVALEEWDRQRWARMQRYGFEGAEVLELDRGISERAMRPPKKPDHVHAPFNPFERMFAHAMDRFDPFLGIDRQSMTGSDDMRIRFREGVPLSRIAQDSAPNYTGGSRIGNGLI